MYSLNVHYNHEICLVIFWNDVLYFFPTQVLSSSEWCLHCQGKSIWCDCFPFPAMRWLLLVYHILSCLHGTKRNDIKIIMHGLPWIPIFVASEAIRQVESLHEWQKIDFNGNPYIILFLTRYILCPVHANPLKQSSIPHCAIATKDSLFSLNIVTSPQLICDVTRTQGNGIVMS